MAEPTDRLAELRASARGWHGVQLAVLGFIGLCGVLSKSSGENLPRWLQVTAGLLVLGALVLACLATGLVAAVAWPVYGAAPPAPASDAGSAPDVLAVGRRLRLGIGITYLAVAATALGATSSWWPHRAPEPAATEVTTNGGVACGQLREARPGALALDVDGRNVVIALSDVLQVRPVATCR